MFSLWYFLPIGPKFSSRQCNNSVHAMRPDGIIYSSKMLAGQPQTKSSPGPDDHKPFANGGIANCVSRCLALEEQVQNAWGWDPVAVWIWYRRVTPTVSTHACVRFGVFAYMVMLLPSSSIL